MAENGGDLRGEVRCGLLPGALRVCGSAHGKEHQNRRDSPDQLR
jgi:hypothetical protein